MPKPPRRPKSVETQGEPTHDTPKTSDLILPGGKVSKRAIYRAAHATHPPQPIKPDATDLDELVEGLDEAARAADAPVAPADDADEPAAQRVVFRLRRDLNKRLDKYLTDRITFMSRSQLQRLIEAGAVLVNSRPAKSSTALRSGDVVEVHVPPPATGDVVEQDLPLDVLFEDEHLIVLNKSPDIIVHPARSNLSGTLINALAYHFHHRSGGALSKVGTEFARPGVVHRLDRQTSGAIVFAKSERAHWLIARQFMDRTVEKRYLAFTHGLIEPRIDSIDLPLGPHPSRQKGYREMQVVRHDHLGKEALTIYRVLAHYPADAAMNGPGPTLPAGYSAVEVELKTGRTHQIRVHLSHLGFPLLADDMYGGRVARASCPCSAPDTGKMPVPLINRVALHAALLEFRHPIDNRPMSFHAPLPADLRSLRRSLRALPGADEFAAPPGARLNLALLDT